MIQSDFGSALRSLRSALGLSQLALANRLSSTQRHISFLETGRSRVTSDFLQRICAELTLSTDQRSRLFEASGMRNPFPERQLKDEEMTAALDTIEARILKNWPFPAFALDKDWSVLRANSGAQKLFASFGITLDAGSNSLLTLVLSPQFLDAIQNWQEVSPGFYFRLMAASERDASVKAAFEAAKASGIFDDVPSYITSSKTAPLTSCAEMALPNGQVLRMTPFIGGLATLLDVRLEQIEIEMMVPLDDATEQTLRGICRD
ncbi:MAG: helix-turn-helix domain-containing protein [Pseudomonadota bacterium]